MNDKPTEQERLDFLIGEVTAVRVGLMAVMATHPDPVALQAQLEDLLTKGLGRLEPTQAPDQAIDGFQAAAKSLRAASTRRRK